jgi:hypothetical protein
MPELPPGTKGVYGAVPKAIAARWHASCKKPIKRLKHEELGAALLLWLELPDWVRDLARMAAQGVSPHVERLQAFGAEARRCFDERRINLDPTLTQQAGKTEP